MYILKKNPPAIPAFIYLLKDQISYLDFFKHKEHAKLYIEPKQVLDTFKEIKKINNKLQKVLEKVNLDRSRFNLKKHKKIIKLKIKLKKYYMIDSYLIYFNILPKLLC